MESTLIWGIGRRVVVGAKHCVVDIPLVEPRSYNEGM